MALNYNKIRLYDDIIKKYYIQFNLNNKKNNKRYLKYNNIYSNIRGYTPPDYTIINRIMFKCSNIISGTIALINKNNGSTLYNFNITNTNNYIEYVNIVIDENVELMIYAESPAGFDNPELCLELII